MCLALERNLESWVRVCSSLSSAWGESGLPERKPDSAVTKELSKGQHIQSQAAKTAEPFLRAAENHFHQFGVQRSKPFPEGKPCNLSFSSYALKSLMPWLHATVLFFRHSFIIREADVHFPAV